MLFLLYNLGLVIYGIVACSAEDRREYLESLLREPKKEEVALVLDDEALNDILARRFVVFHRVLILYSIVKMYFIAFETTVSLLNDAEIFSSETFHLYTSIWFT